jgi:hypothetical protein
MDLLQNLSRGIVRNLRAAGRELERAFVLYGNRSAEAGGVFLP